MKNRQGIYLIIGRYDGRAVVYVGSTKSFGRRKSTHTSRLSRNCHANGHLQAAWNKHGEVAFEFLFWESVSDVGNLCARETYWLEVFRSKLGVYNIANPEPAAPMPEEVRRKISRAHCGKAKRRDAVLAMADKLAHHYPALENMETGEIIPAGRNIKALCRKHGFNYGNMFEVISGRGYSCQGWIIQGTEAPTHHNSKPFPVFQHRETGQVVGPGENLSALCQEFDLDVSAMWRVAGGKQRHHQGWELLSRAGCSQQGHSQEHRQKIAAALAGHSVDQETRAKIAKVKAKEYPAFVHGQTDEVIQAGHNLAALCRERGLTPRSMWDVVYGTRSHHKGWRLTDGSGC